MLCLAFVYSHFFFLLLVLMYGTDFIHNNPIYLFRASAKQGAAKCQLSSVPFHHPWICRSVASRPAWPLGSLFQQGENKTTALALDPSITRTAATRPRRDASAAGRPRPPDLFTLRALALHVRAMPHAARRSRRRRRRCCC